MASLLLAYDETIRDQLVEKIEVDPETADDRSHRAEGDGVSAATFEAFQQSGKCLHLGADFPGTLGVLGWRRNRQQRRRGRDDPFGLPRHLLRCQRRRDPPRRDAIENVADLVEGEDRDTRTDHRETADPEEGKQQSACHAEPGQHPGAGGRPVGDR